MNKGKYLKENGYDTAQDFLYVISDLEKEIEKDKEELDKLLAQQIEAQEKKLEVQMKTQEKNKIPCLI